MAGSVKTEASCCARSATARPIGSCISTPRSAAEWERSPRACAARKSRFGGRLEPFFRVDLVLYEGRSELLTVTSAETVAGHPRLREHGGALDAAARACDAVGAAVRRRRPARRRVQPARQRARAARRRARRAPGAPTRSPSASSCCSPPASCRSSPAAPRAASASTSAGFSGAAGGVVCTACEAGAFPLDEAAHAFLVEALGRPLAEAPAAARARSRQAERAIARDARAPRPRAPARREHASR